jgi:pimeloyl-ACP methyl ester carboxylesterase
VKRRQFLIHGSAALAAAALCEPAFAAPGLADPARFAAARRFAALDCGRIAYIDHGKGEAALFLHGVPLNGYQWRGAVDLLAPQYRCIVPDFMGLGYSDVPASQALGAADQASMLAALLDCLKIASVHIVAADSGGAVAQLFAVRYPQRVRTMLLTNCDVEPDSPPPTIAPVLDMARNGTLAQMTEKWLTDRALARSTFGTAVYRDPASFSDDTIDMYVKPLVATARRRAQYHAFHIALAPNPLAGIEARLRALRLPVRIVWGASDTVFDKADPVYLDRLFAHSRGIRYVAEGKLFFQEEYPDVIADEARLLWGGQGG